MKFIVFEGLDGSGKSTQILQLKQFLDSRKVPSVCTREPGGTPLGDRLRDIILDKVMDAPVPKAELFLYEAIRSQHVEKLILPTLKLGTWVISDRYASSSIAFQAGGRSLDSKIVHFVNNFATGGLEPDLTVLLDLPHAGSRSRMKVRLKDHGQDLDRFEQESEDFHEKVRQAYLDLAKKNSNSWLLIDSTQSPDRVHSQIVEELVRRSWLKS